MSSSAQQQHSNIGTSIRCQGCQSLCTKNLPQCLRPGGWGCQRCRRKGIVCIAGNTVFPPNPEDTTMMYCPRCDSCRANHRRCDYARPCQSCTDAGDVCTGNRTNCFWRGVRSTEMYGYFLNLGYGPTGINDPHVVYGWQQPANYHLEYVQSLQNAQQGQGHGLIIHNPYRVLYQELLEVAGLTIARGVPIDLQAVFDRFTVDLNSHTPISESRAYQDLKTYIQNTSNQQNQERIPSRAIEYPEGTDFNLLQTLNPGRQFQGFVAPLANITRAPLDRPLSPAPARPQYYVPVGTREESLGVIPNEDNYPADHPEIVDMTRLQRPLAAHPFSAGLSPLASIPYKRIWTDGLQYTSEQHCQATSSQPTSSVCTNPTRSGCEDNCHYGDGFPICDHCEVQSRDRFMEHFQSMVMSLRAYACADCTGDPNFLEQFENSGLTIWWAYGEFPHTEEPPIDVTEVSLLTAGGYKVGGWRGRPLDITGCSCALKLFGRRICSPHRLQYMIKMDETARKIREYVIGLYGKMVCPFCRRNAGVDAYNFAGAQGREKNSTARTKTGPFPVVSLNSPAAPPPFNPAEEEINARVLKDTSNVGQALVNALGGPGAASGST
ncbi:hypothetical protein F5X99DRAFT_426191 [Biscogniauxia marginata]|nr:hypothetical protein F5X99DRAFT_426191 [Biscogniauxia marginata]